MGFLISEIAYFVTIIDYEIVYVTGNVSSILGYVFLFIHTINDIDFKKLLKKLYIHTTILVLLGIYIFYSLDSMIDYHSPDLSILFFVIESLYNFFIMLVLIFSLLNYLYNMNNKALFLFLACMFLCFSELVEVANSLIDEILIINCTYAVFYLVSYYFFYRYIIIDDKADMSNLVIE